jgi:hypothetical protein
VDEAHREWKERTGEAGHSEQVANFENNTEKLEAS